MIGQLTDLHVSALSSDPDNVHAVRLIRQVLRPQHRVVFFFVVAVVAVVVVVVVVVVAIVVVVVVAVAFFKENELPRP